MQFYLVQGWGWRILHWEVSRPNQLFFVTILLLWEHLTWYFQNVVSKFQRHDSCFSDIDHVRFYEAAEKKMKEATFVRRPRQIQTPASSPVRHPSQLLQSLAGPRCSSAGGVEMKIRTHRGRRSTITWGIIEIIHFECQTDLKICKPQEPQVAFWGWYSWYNMGTIYLAAHHR